MTRFLRYSWASCTCLLRDNVHPHYSLWYTGRHGRPTTLKTTANMTAALCRSLCCFAWLKATLLQKMAQMCYLFIVGKRKQKRHRPVGKFCRSQVRLSELLPVCRCKRWNETMSHEYVVDKIVTNFLLNTCRLRPLPGNMLERSDSDSSSSQRRNRWPHSADNRKCCRILHWTDVTACRWYRRDVSWQHFAGNTTRTSTTNTAIPAEFSDYGKVFEIVDRHLPGYV